MGDVDLKQFSVGKFNNNVYILVDPETKDSVLFDAPFEAARILEALQGTNLRAILMTHTDMDHVQVLDEVRSATGARVGVHPQDAGNLPGRPDFELRDGETLHLGSIELKVIHTPGHTPGSVCFLTDSTLIAGDTLFPGGPGSKSGQLSKAEFDQLIDSIRQKLFTLPDHTNVYPGHGSSTTIGSERPHLQEWIDRGW